MQKVFFKCTTLPELLAFKKESTSCIAKEVQILTDVKHTSVVVYYLVMIILLLYVFLEKIILWHLHNGLFLARKSDKDCHFPLFCFSGKPEAVQNCTVTNESTDSFQVTCQPGFNGGLPQHFTLTVYKVSTDNGELNLAANLSSALPSFTVSGLDPGSKYVGELLGHNVKGMGVPTQIHVYTLKLPEKLIPHLDDGSSNGKFYIKTSDMHMKYEWFSITVCKYGMVFLYSKYTLLPAFFILQNWSSWKWQHLVKKRKE